MDGHVVEKGHAVEKASEKLCDPRTQRDLLKEDSVYHAIAAENERRAEEAARARERISEPPPPHVPPRAPYSHAGPPGWTPPPLPQALGGFAGAVAPPMILKQPLPPPPYMQAAHFGPGMGRMPSMLYGGGMPTPPQQQAMHGPPPGPPGIPGPPGPPMYSQYGSTMLARPMMYSGGGQGPPMPRQPPPPPPPGESHPIGGQRYGEVDRSNVQQQSHRSALGPSMSPRLQPKSPYTAPWQGLEGTRQDRRPSGPIGSPGAARASFRDSRNGPSNPSKRQPKTRAEVERDAVDSVYNELSKAVVKDITRLVIKPAIAHAVKKWKEVEVVEEKKKQEVCDRHKAELFAKGDTKGVCEKRVYVKRGCVCV